MLIRVGNIAFKDMYKLQFVKQLERRVLTWGRRVPASVFACQGSMP